MSKLVIYHAGCSDGWCSAWLFKQCFPAAELMAAQYGEPPPDVTQRDEVFVVDFSYPRAVMLHMIAQCRGNITVLDHHKTAEKELAGICDQCARTGREEGLIRLPVVTFDMAKSGARLAFEYLWARQLFHGPCPWLVDYTEDRDLWKWELPQSREVNAAIRSYPMDVGTWDFLDVQTPAKLAIEGGAILRDQLQTVAAHVSKAWEIEIAGHKVLAVNATTMISEVAGELAKGRPFGATFFDRGDGFRIWSLRSRDGGIDVSEIAKANGGGGHRNAAGFQEKL